MLFRVLAEADPNGVGIVRFKDPQLFQDNDDLPPSNLFILQGWSMDISFGTNDHEGTIRALVKHIHHQDVENYVKISCFDVAGVRL